MIKILETIGHQKEEDLRFLTTDGGKDYIKTL
jgi:hypothetical protein